MVKNYNDFINDKEVNDILNSTNEGIIGDFFKKIWNSLILYHKIH